MAVAIDKYTCPFCGQKAIFVGVHDDEGNYKGRPGCEYESDPWSGLCYAIHHDGWGDCILCTDAHDLPLGGCFFDTAEEAFQAIPTLTQPNEPLTFEERRKMDGKPVWLDDEKTWGILQVWDDNNVDVVFLSPRGCVRVKSVIGKKIYRRPPEGEEETP